MKKSFVLVAMAALLFSGFAMAANDVFMLDAGGAWVPADPVCDASMEHSGNWAPMPDLQSPGNLATPCNPMYYWTFCCLPCCDVRPDGNPLVIKTTAEVHQWLQASFAGTEVTWVVQHPGTYAADTLFFQIMSNDNVLIIGEGGGNLINEDPSAPGDTEIELFWAEGVGAVPVDWCPAWLFDDIFGELQIRREPEHKLEFHLWQKIIVEKCNTAGIYSNETTITFCPTFELDI